MRTRAVVALIFAALLPLPTAADIPPPTWMGHPAVSPLENIEGRRFCSAVYLQKAGETLEEGSGLSWVASAGHCALSGPVAYLRGTPNALGRVDWGYAVQGHDDIMDNARVDFALGTVPDARADTSRWFFPLADADPKPGDRVWVHGYPEGTERLTQGIVSTPYLGGMELTLEDPITFGSSGSPVLDARGHVVGVITHMRATTPWDRESNHALFTPVSHLRLALAHLGVRLWSGGTPSLVL